MNDSNKNVHDSDKQVLASRVGWVWSGLAAYVVVTGYCAPSTLAHSPQVYIAFPLLSVGYSGWALLGWRKQSFASQFVLAMFLFAGGTLLFLGQ